MNTGREDYLKTKKSFKHTEMKNRERILIILGYSLQGYNQLVEHAAYKWLDRYFTDSDLKNKFVKSKRFWEWWNNEWDIRDEEYLYETSLRFICEPLTGEDLQEALHFFIEKHMVKKLEIIPNKWVREEIDQLIRAEQEKIKSLTQKK